MSHVCGKVLMLVNYIFIQIKDYLSVNSLNLFLTIYNSYSKHKNYEVKMNFLFNFPAILSLSGKKFEFFQDSYMICCNDQNEGVQRYLAASFHEVVLLSENTEILTHVFIGFMKGKCVAILDILVNRFTLIVNSFQKHVVCSLYAQSVTVIIWSASP